MLRAIAVKYGITTKQLLGPDKSQYLDYPRMEAIQRFRQFYGYPLREIARVVQRSFATVQVLANRDRPEKPLRKLLFTYSELLEVHDRYVSDPTFRRDDIGVTSTSWARLLDLTHWNYAYWIFIGETTHDELKDRLHWRRTNGRRRGRPPKVRDPYA